MFMGNPQVIGWLIAGLTLFAVFLIFNKFFLRLVKLILSGVLASLGFMLCNSILAITGAGISVGVNVVTFLVGAFLGFPGFVTLYALQLIH
jgi:hypothetical protein